MRVEEYYRYQAVARGLRTPEDVRQLCAAQGPLYQRLLGPYLPSSRDARIHEVACGPGIFLLWLAEKGYSRATGSDSSPEQIALARTIGLPVEEADSLAQLKGMPENSLDLLVAIDFYEHLPKEVLLDFFVDARRALRPGGRLVLRGPNGDSPLVGRNLFNDITHHWALTSTAFRSVLGMCGFGDVVFLDEVLAGIQRGRLLKLPFMWLARESLRLFLAAATRERIPSLGSSFFVVAVKPENSI